MLGFAEAGTAVKVYAVRSAQHGAARRGMASHEPQAVGYTASLLAVAKPRTPAPPPPAPHSLRPAAPVSDSVKVKLSAGEVPEGPPRVGCTLVMKGSHGTLAHTQCVATDPENWSPTQ